MLSTEIEFKNQHTNESGGLEPVLTNYGRTYLFANGARMDRVPVSGEWALILPSFNPQPKKRILFDYWTARYERVKDRFDELWTKMDQHLQGSMNNPGFPPPSDSEWKQLESLRDEVQRCKAEMEKYRADNLTPTLNPQQFEMVEKAESMKRQLHRMRV